MVDLIDYNDPEVVARQRIAPNAACTIDGHLFDIRNLLHRIATLAAENERLAKERDLMAREWCDFCDAMGVTVDTQEAVASILLARTEKADEDAEFFKAQFNDQVESREEADARAEASAAVKVKAENIEEQAWKCDEWPEWLHRVVDQTNEIADKWDMSSEQAHAYAVLLALATEPAAPRPCTCHPDDNSPTPCAEKYAYSECAAAPHCPQCDFGIGGHEPTCPAAPQEAKPGRPSGKADDEYRTDYEIGLDNGYALKAQEAETFPQPARKDGGDPCGECHIQPGEACDICGAVGAPQEAEAVATFQQRVQPWMIACFGPGISADRLERGDRLLEEVLELLQSGDYPRERIASLTDYTYGREKGEPSQEVGGVQVTLAAYCLAHGFDMHEAAETELARIWTKVDKIRAKQAAKPTGSALPIAITSRPAQAVTEARRFQLGDRVTKTKGSSWTGRVVGFYSTALNPTGYCVESENELGSVQIYPEAALKAAQEASHDPS